MELQKDRIVASTAVIEKIFVNPDKETAELIHQAKEEYDSKFIFVLNFSFSSMVNMICTKLYSSTVFMSMLFIPDLPEGHQLHDIMVLMNFDASKLCGKTLGSASVRKHQELLQQHWSSSEVATLPGDNIQCCLLGVSYYRMQPYVSFILNQIDCFYGTLS